MRITIDGDSKANIRQACLKVAAALRSHGKGGQPSTKTEVRQARFIARRRLLRRAFDITRPNPDDRIIVTNLARALGGSASITDALIDMASLICSETGRPEDAKLVELGVAAHRSLESEPSKRR